MVILPTVTLASGLVMISVSENDRGFECDVPVRPPNTQRAVEVLPLRQRRLLPLLSVFLWDSPYLEPYKAVNLSQ